MRLVQRRMLHLPNAARTVVVTAALTAGTIACGDDQQPPPIVAPGPSVALQLTSVFPNSGVTSASTNIALTGAGFVAGATLTIGGTAVPLTVTNSSNARAAAPPHAAGPVDVIITNPNGERSQLTGGFRYIALPVRLEISGNTALQAIGETSQLTATATLADGSTVDVTREGQWVVTFVTIATISPDGLLTAKALGTTPISVRYPVSSPSVFRGTQVTVTPSGSFALSGRVREPGAGSVANARVVHLDSGTSVESNADGYFGFGGLTGRTRLRITKLGFEDSETEQELDAYFDAPLQRVVALAAGAAAYSSRLAPNDVTHDVGGGASCQPCRLIRVTSASPGIFSVTLRWSGPETLQIWVDGHAVAAEPGNREISANVNVGAGDTLVYVGRPRSATGSDYIPFNVVVR